MTEDRVTSGIPPLREPPAAAKADGGPAVKTPSQPDRRPRNGRRGRLPPAKVRWHRDLAPARTSRAPPTGGDDHHDIRTGRPVSHAGRRPAVGPPAAGPDPGLGAPPPGARRGDVPHRAGPFGPGPGGRPRPARPADGAALRRGERRRGHRRGHAQPGRAGRRRGHRTRDHACSASPRSLRRSTCGGPRSTPGCPRSWTTPP
jgi:hypothetical protein